MTTDDVMVDEVHLYGIVRAGQRVPGDEPGLDGSGLQILEHGDVAAVVGRVAAGRRVGRRADLLAHARVLDTLARSGPVAPVRFGTWCPTVDEVIGDVLAPHAEYFRTVLDRLSGRSQFTLRVAYDEETVLSELVTENAEIARLRSMTRGRPAEATHHARVRLGELVARGLEAKRRTDGQVILEVLLPHVVAHAVRDGAGLDHLLDVAFLVDLSHREAFEDAAEAAAARLGDRGAMRLIGPTAPYDFVPERD